jgi:2Fe-2S iron-sulfur cluster binding domain
MSETKQPIKFTLDRREVEAPAGETIFRTARRYGIELLNLCYSPAPGYRPDGNCRICLVEIEGERVLAASCIRTPTPGMKVNTQTDRAATARRMVAELLLADQPERDVAHDPQSHLWQVIDGSPRHAFLRAPIRQRPTAATPPWRSISTPASSAISVSAPAAKCRSTTSSAWPAVAMARRSYSISTIPWAPRPASPAGNACRPAPPAR